MSSNRSLITLFVSVAATTLVMAQGEDRRGRAAFMREKLAHSKNILEGLTREDYSQIKKGARALKAMRESPEWPAMDRPEAGRYGVYASEQLGLLEDLVTKAEQKKLDEVTQVYLRLTTNCVNCHKELRSRRK